MLDGGGCSEPSAAQQHLALQQGSVEGAAI
jgi:hypothetical protein